MDKPNYLAPDYPPSFKEEVTSGSIKYTYIGWKSEDNAATSDKKWYIMRISEDTSTGNVVIEYPNGQARYNYVWDDRLTYTYSY
jgi:hypothetical protein